MKTRIVSQRFQTLNFQYRLTPVSYIKNLENNIYFLLFSYDLLSCCKWAKPFLCSYLSSFSLWLQISVSTVTLGFRQSLQFSNVMFPIERAAFLTPQCCITPHARYRNIGHLFFCGQLHNGGKEM